MTVADLMSRQLLTVTLDHSLAQMRELLEERRIHHLVVLDDESAFVGIISDRDVLRALSPFVGTTSEEGRDERTLHRKAHQIMTRHPVTVKPTTTIQEAGTLLLEGRISCLPVVDDDGALVGICTTRDLLRAFVQQAA